MNSILNFFKKPINDRYNKKEFHERLYAKVSKDRQEYREKALCFACKNDYGHTDNINEIDLNTQFYEVNTNNGYVSRPKQKTEDTKFLIESTAPYFIITNEDIDQYALLPELQNTGGKRIKGTRKSKRKNIII